ncbi:hypothetical protein [Paenibacillus elgii]|uniref:hypothetical protein n=1 Tax=Paenibacillus elgii TaxID=189691 RepID=UPI000248C6C6|nr:hypothetical protein [Paenibacillus elgii]
MQKVIHFIRSVFSTESLNSNDDELSSKFKELMKDYLRMKNKYTNEIEIVSIHNVLSIDFQKDFSLLITREHEYLFPITKQGLAELLEDRNFVLSDADLHVNLDQAIKIHSDSNLLFFDDVESVKEAREKECYTAYINSRHLPFFKRHFGKENDLAYKLEMNKDKRAKSTFSFRKKVDLN